MYLHRASGTILDVVCQKRSISNQIDFFSAAGSLEPSAIVKVSGQSRAPFRWIPPTPNMVPDTVPNKVPDRCGTGFQIHFVSDI